MDSPTDAVVRLVYAVGVAEIVLIPAILAGVFILKLSNLHRARRRKRFHDLWRPIFVQSLAETPRSIPAVSEKDAPIFLYYWNYFHQSLLGEDKMSGLNELARSTGMDQAARRLLMHTSIANRLIAIVTLGHLRDRSVWPQLAVLAASKNHVVSLASARAMIHIDATAAMPILTPLLASRADWSPAKVASLLSEAGQDAIAKPLAEAAATARPEMAVRLIHYLEVTKCAAALPRIRALIRETKDPAVRVACLKLIGHFADPHDLLLVRGLLADDNGKVRAEAARGLGKMGVDGDVDRLLPLLRDPQWEVRYRAAEALAQLPFMTPTRLSAIRAAQTNPQARDILVPFIEAAARAQARPPASSGRMEDMGDYQW
ncbi:HEAT repeat domain-containing protein [Candidatus Nitrospira bockiana]